MKPSAALLIGLAPKGAKSPKASEPEEEGADLELLGQELLDAIAAKDAKRVCEAVVACMAAESSMASAEEEDDDEEDDDDE